MKHHSLYLKYFSKQNMKRQLITLFICAILIPVVVIGGIIGYFASHRLTKNYQELTDSQARLVHSTIVSSSIYLHSIYQSVSDNDQIRQLLCEDGSTFDAKAVTADITDTFENTLSNTAMLTSIKLYLPDKLMENVQKNNYLVPLSEDLMNTYWYQKSQKISGNFWISDIRAGQNNVQYQELYYCCHIPFPSKQSSALLVMSISNDYLRNLIANDRYEIYVTVNDDPVFFSSDRSYAGKKFPKKLNAVTSLETANLYQSGDKIHILVADTNALPAVHKLCLIFLLVIAFALLISGIIIFLYAGYFSSRINTLRLAMYRVSNNDYEIVDTIRGDDELTATFHDMKVMVGKLKAAEAEIYQAQIREQQIINQQQQIVNQQQQMEFKLLASQINPHFLYNTLESIRMKAFSEGNREIANAIKLLSKSMRYVLSNTKTTSTTLDKELDYVSNYLAIQQMRFGSRIGYEIQISPAFSPVNYQILPILIQPLVENAIAHGLEDTGEDGHIIVRVRPSKDRTLLICHVFDNGVGMSRETMERVLAQMHTPSKHSTHGVGLYNIDNRIRLFYGEEYGLTIRSKEHWGTCVTVTIPLCNLSEEE